MVVTAYRTGTNGPPPAHRSQVLSQTDRRPPPPRRRLGSSPGGSAGALRPTPACGASTGGVRTDRAAYGAACYLGRQTERSLRQKSSAASLSAEYRNARDLTGLASIDVTVSLPPMSAVSAGILLSWARRRPSDPPPRLRSDGGEGFRAPARRPGAPPLRNADIQIGGASAVAKGPSRRAAAAGRGAV